MGEDGTFGAWHQIRLQLDVVEACARELDPRVCPRVVALRQQVDAGLEPHRVSERGENDGANLSEIVQDVQDMVRDLREVLAAEGAALPAAGDDLTPGSHAPAAGVVGRRRRLVENAEKLFRVSNTMWDVLRSAE